MPIGVDNGPCTKNDGQTDKGKDILVDIYIGRQTTYAFIVQCAKRLIQCTEVPTHHQNRAKSLEPAYCETHYSSVLTTLCSEQSEDEQMPRLTVSQQTFPLT